VNWLNSVDRFFDLRRPSFQILDPKSGLRQVEGSRGKPLFGLRKDCPGGKEAAAAQGFDPLSGDRGRCGLFHGVLRRL